MATTKRCPHCGASNPESAQWCSLCLERFEEPEPVLEPSVPPSAADPDRPDAVVEVADAAGPDAPVAPTAAEIRQGAFKYSEGNITWTCSVCGNENPLEALTCDVCGTRFADSLRPKEERPQRDPGTATLLSVLLPGAGHMYLGLWGQGLARTVIMLWVLSVAILGIVQDVPGALALAVVFGVVAVSMWVVNAYDSYQEARGLSHQTLLRGRGYLFLVLGLLFLLFVVIFMAGLGAQT